MKVIEKDLISDGNKLGTYLAYADIEPEFIVSDTVEHKGIRVLPAPYFYEKGLHFTLIKRYEPGEHKYFPNGGFEIRGETPGSVFNYDLDQVIIHPAILKHQKTLDKMTRRAEKEARKRDKRIGKAEKKAAKQSRRGRPALSAEEKAIRDAAKLERGERSGNKRGRPKGTGTPKPPKQSTGKGRGRPKLSDEAKAIKEAAKATIQAKSGGKRGRPKTRS